MSRYMKILMYSVFYIGCLNFINSCCPSKESKESEEKKLSKEYIAKALGVTEDKIWAFDIYSDDLDKILVSNKKNSGFLTYKLLVDNVDNEKYSDSCFVMLEYFNINNPKKNKCCCALVCGKSSISVNNDVLKPCNLEYLSKQEKKDDVVMFSIVKDIDNFYKCLVNYANASSISYNDLSKSEAISKYEKILKRCAPDLTKQKLLEVYVCK